MGTEVFKQFLEKAFSPVAKDRLSLQNHFNCLYGPVLINKIEDDCSYPRLSQGEVQRIRDSTEKGILIPVRATRQLRVDHSYEQFVEACIKKTLGKGGRLTRDELSRIAEQTMEEVIDGQMERVSVGNFEGVFEGIKISTDPELVIEAGTLGVIESVDWDLFPPHLCVFWEGFDEKNPGKVSWLTSISHRPGPRYDFVFFLDVQPEKLGMTVQRQIMEHCRHSKFAGTREGKG